MTTSMKPVVFVLTSSTFSFQIRLPFSARHFVTNMLLILAALILPLALPAQNVMTGTAHVNGTSIYYEQKG
ncbi:MAG TPA: hypothetical protein VF251_11300, partial [Pyrinomonadaceae bacterium]